MRKKFATSSGGGVNLGLIVTPMLDMSFQLLSFFIMVYTPNTGEEFISGELGRTKSVLKDAFATKGPEKGKKPLPPISDVPELEGAVTVLLLLEHPDPEASKEPKGALPKLKEGEEGLVPKYLQIRTPAHEIDKAAAKDRLTLLDFKKLGDAKVLATLQDELERYHADFTGKRTGKEEAKGDAKKEGGVKTKLKIESDRHIQFDYVIQVYAVAQRIGFDDITFTKPLD